MYLDVHVYIICFHFCLFMQKLILACILVHIKNLLFSIYIYIHLKQTLKWGSYTSFTFNMCGVRDAKGWEAPIYIIFYLCIYFLFFCYLFIFDYLQYLFFCYLFLYLFIFLHLCKTTCILFFVPSFLITICILGELHLFTYIFKYIRNIHIYVFHLCFTICILGEMYIQIFIYDKTPKVHRGGGWTPPLRGGYCFLDFVCSQPFLQRKSKQF